LKCQPELVTPLVTGWLPGIEFVAPNKNWGNAIMIPGMVTQSNVMVQHPESVAQRLGRRIDAFGVERVIAGTDCGFAGFAGNDEIHETIVWAKFDALVKGTQIASKAARTRRLTA
jgi:5-methyltetrahydropteroyltriglutamate--homocysteine methyltransferase